MPPLSDADQIILPPPSALHPIPSLDAALRLDNRDQLLECMLEEEESSTTGRQSLPLRQLLIFEDDSLRQLLLRQVLNDPTSKMSSASQTAKKQQNWEVFDKFSYPSKLSSSIVATKIIYSTGGPTGTRRRRIFSANGPEEGTTTAYRTSTTSGGGTEISMTPDSLSSASGDVIGEDMWNVGGQHVDVVKYFLRPHSTHSTEWLASRLMRNVSAASSITSGASRLPRTVQHKIVYVPHITPLIQQVWQDSGLLAHTQVTYSTLSLDLFPMDTDVLSMECSLGMMQEALLEGTPSSFLQQCSRTFLKLQDIIGTPSRIQAMGPMAEDILQKSLQQNVQDYLQQNGNGATPSPSGNPATSMAAACIMIDRQVDWVTPFLTPLTYQGLLDELLGVDHGYLQVPLCVIQPPEDDAVEAETDKKKTKTPAPNTKVSLSLVQTKDSLFTEVRDQHVEKFGHFLQSQAKALKESHANFRGEARKKDLQEIHQFVKQIPMFTQNLRSLTNHIQLAELIKKHTEQVSFREQWQTERSILEGEVAYDVLEEWICSYEPIEKVLRGLCLQSLCGNGLKASRYDYLRQLIVQGYGYEYLLKLHDLERLGWVRRKDTFFDSQSSAFASLRKSLILIHAEVNTVEPDDIAYVSSGYAPLSVRLVQAAMQGWTKSRAEIWKDSLPGRCVDVEPTWPPQELTNLETSSSSSKTSLGDYAKKFTSSSSSGKNKKPTLIVFYIGGISYMEIAALRFLSKRPNFPYHVVMVTTQVINGNTMLQQTLEEKA